MNMSARDKKILLIIIPLVVDARIMIFSPSHRCPWRRQHRPTCTTGRPRKQLLRKVKWEALALTPRGRRGDRRGRA